MPDQPTFEKAVQELLRAGAFANCPMCGRNEDRHWKYGGPDALTGPTLRLVCSNCSYIVEFDLSEIDAAIKRRERGV